MVKVTSILGAILILALLVASAATFFSSISPVFAQEAGVTVNPTSGLITTEAGGTDTFTVVLNTRPTANVYIELSSSDTSEGTISPSEHLVFTKGKWNTPQTATVTGVDDDTVDGDIAYTIVTAAAISTDPDYNGLDSDDVSVTNQDDDSYVVTITATDASASESGSNTGEFTISRTGGTLGALTVYFTVSGTATDGTDYWSIGTDITIPDDQASTTITITPIEDPTVEGTETVVVTLVVDGYTIGTPSSDTVSIADDDVVGVTVNPTSGLITTEAGGTDTFTVVLNIQPTDDVSIDLSSQTPSEGNVSPSSLTFTPGNWNTPQTATVTGVDDDTVDGDIAYTIVTAAAISTDPDYNGLDPDDVSVTNQDDEITPSGGGGGGAPPIPGFTSLPPGIIRADGILNFPVVAVSQDNNIKIELARGTRCLSRHGLTLAVISILPIAEIYWPQHPADATIIGIVYEYGPNGATFDPPGTLIITYDEPPIPEDVNEEDLIIAYWDGNAEEWVALENCIVDPEENTITAPISHFTPFTVLAYEVAPLAAAAFEINSLTITPTELEIGEELVISVQVSNTGDKAGSIRITLKVDSEALATEDIIDLAGGATQKITFTTTKDAAGTYTVDINGKTGTFVVKSAQTATPTSYQTISPTEVDIAESITISTLVTNTGDTTGKYEVTLEVDNIVVKTRNITLTCSATEEITFTTTFPSELNTGERTTISALFTNNGDTTGTNEVILKVDNVIVATKHITLPVGTNEDATFVIVKDSDKTYSLNINELSGTIVVSKPPPLGIDQWLIIVIIAPIVIAGSTAYLLIRSARFRNLALSLTGQR